MNPKLKAEIEAHRLAKRLRNRSRSVFEPDRERQARVKQTAKARAIWQSETPHRQRAKELERQDAMIRAAAAGEDWAVLWLRDEKKYREQARKAALKKVRQTNLNPRTSALNASPVWSEAWAQARTPTKEEAIVQIKQRQKAMIDAILRRKEAKAHVQKVRVSSLQALQAEFAKLDIRGIGNTHRNPERAGNTPPSTKASRDAAKAALLAEFKALKI